MLTRLRSWLDPSLLDEETKNHTARLLWLIMWVILGVAGLYLLSALAKLSFWLGAQVGVVWLSTLGLMLLLRRGQVRLTALLLVTTLWLFLTLLALTGGGVHGPAYVAYLVLIAMTGLLLGGKAGIGLALVSVMGGGVMAWMEETGWLPPTAGADTASALWVDSVIAFMLVAVFQNMATRRISDLLTRTRAELAERQRAEQALSHSEERLQLALAAAHTGTWDWDIPREVVTWSDNVAALFGLERHEFSGQYADYLKLIHPADVHLVQTAIADALTGKLTPYFVEHRICLPDGTLRWLEGKGTVRRDATGRPLRMIGTVLDITARKQAEHERQSAAALLSLVMNAVPDLVFVKDPALRTILCNEAFARALGQRPEDLYGHTDLENGWAPDLVHGDPARGVRGFRADDLTALSGQAVHNPYDPANVEGDIRIFDTHKLPLRDAAGQVIGVLGVARDVTERERVADALRDAEHKYRTLVEQLPVVVYTCEVGALGRWHFVSPQIETLLGFTPEAWLADPGLWFRQMHPDDRARQMQLEEQAYASAQSLVAEYRIFTQAGQERWIRDELRVLPQAASGPLVVQGTLSDVTAWHRAAAATQGYLARLEVLHEIEQSLRAAESPQAIAQAATDNLRRLVACERVSIALFNFATQRVAFIAVSSAIPTHLPTGAVVTLDEFGQALINRLRSDELHRIDDVSALTEIPETDRRHLADGIRTWLYAPLLYRGELIGSVNLGAIRSHVFTADQADLVRDVANLLSIAIQQSRLFESTHRRVRELSTLHLVGVTIGTAQTEAALLQQVAQIISDQLYSMVLGILLLDPAAGVLRPHEASRGIRPEILRETAPLGQGVIGTVAAQGVARRLPDVRRAPDYVVMNPDTLSELCVPLKVGDRVLGVINLESDQLNSFSEDDERVLSTLAGQLATALERLRAEQAVRDSEALYRRAIAAAGAVPYYFDYASNTYRFMGEGIEPLTGYAADEMTPELWAGLQVEYHLMGPAAQYAQPEAVQRARAGEFPWKVDSRIRTRTGATRWVADASVEIRTETGQSQGAIGILQDVTERREAEARIRQLNESLEHRVAERTEALSAANAALAKASRLKDEFLASMSHELRTPLTGILAFAQVMQKQIYGPLTEKQLKAMRSIEDSGKHLLELINDILDLSKIEAGKLELEPGLVLADDICQASLRLVKQMAQTKQLDLSFQLDPSDLQVWADARRLKQMLVNLLSNAVKFTPEGGRVGLEVSGDTLAHVARFTVWDTGIGIAPEDLPKLFQSFVQLDSRLAREYSGTGLGLALVRRMAEMHGGGVRVESDGIPGRGSRFTITLPWNRAPESGLAAPLAPAWRPILTVEDAPSLAEQQAHHSNRRPYLLLAEDNPMTITVITDYLIAQGYEVQVAPNGQAAVQQARARQPQLILMDVQMPGVDGLEATRLIRREPGLETVPIIALTALVMPGDRERCLAAGADGYLTKPINLDELAQLIRTHLSAAG